MKTYFVEKISSLADLKKQFRVLVLANHPDRGGSTEAMQAINAEFEKLYKEWEHKKPASNATNTGYETDYAGATAREYSEYVYNEYAWKGSRYNSNLTKEDLVGIFRQWLKDTYPNCKFSVNRNGWNSINVHILKMDFNPFATEEVLKRYEVNSYHIDKDKVLNDRARDVVENISSYLLSYNYDNSNVMTDYFDRGFYESIEFGNSKTPFIVEIPRARRTGGTADPGFKRPIGKAHAAIKKALGKAYFAPYNYKGSELLLLGEDSIYSDESKFYPLYYGGYKTAEKRVIKLKAAGIECRILNDRYCRIQFLGYNPEVENALAEEDRAANEAERIWNEQKATSQEAATEKTPYGASEKSQTFGSFEVVDYSEKAVALFGDTKPISSKLSDIGGRFNPALRYGNEKRSGWVFSKKQVEALTAFLSGLQEANQGTERKEQAPDMNAIPAGETGGNVEREKLSDTGFQALCASIEKRYVAAGYTRTKAYLKEKLANRKASIQQLRYIAYLLSEYLYRLGKLDEYGDAA